MSSSVTAMKSNNVIHWFESAAMDKPELRSPQPCKRGIHCDYKLKDEATGELVRACCSGVHPGEEGTGRRLFPARTLDDGKQQPACVRLTGASQGFYERRRLRLSWAQWCEEKGIPFVPALPGQPFEPLVRAPLGGKKPDATIQAAMELCQPYMRERHPMQEHASVGGSTAFGLNPRAFDVMAQQHAERSLDPRMMSRGFLAMPGAAMTAPMTAPMAAAQPQVENRSKIALKNARKRANKKAAAEALAAAAAPVSPLQSECYNCARHSARLPLGWVPEGGSPWATPVHDPSVPAGSSCGGCSTPQRPSRISLSGGGGAEQKWAVSGRGGECSPDCCCPTGITCHDRILPPLLEQEDGTASPVLTTALATKGDFEALD